MSTTINPAHQTFILARLQEFCRYDARTKQHQRDPWSYMREKLLQLEPSMGALKDELLSATRERLLSDLKAGPVSEESYSDFKLLFERLLTRGDFVDVAMHMSAAAGPNSHQELSKLLKQAKSNHVFLEEQRAPTDRNPTWEKLVKEIYSRLGLDALGALLERKKKTPRRRAAALRLVRRNVAEYCAVVRIPTNPTDTFTPFMLPRIEALIGACLRFLNKYR